MAEKKLQYKIGADASQAIKSIDQLEKELEGLNEQIKDVNNKNEFDVLARQIANANSELKNLELSMEGLDAENKASEFGSFASGLADTTTGAFALAGAMGLTNSSIEENIETIVQGFAVANAFRSGIEGIISAQKLLRASTIAQTVATNGSTVATRILNAVMNANPVFLLITGITALVGVMALYASASGDARTEQELLNEAQTAAAEGIGEEIAQLDTLVLTLKSETSTRAQKEKVISELNDKYPEFLGNIDLEKTSQEDLNKAIQNQIKLMDLQAQAKALQEIKTEQYKEKIKELTDAQTGQNVGVLDHIQAFGLNINAQELANQKTKESINLKNEEINATNKLIDSTNSQIGALTAEYDARVKAEADKKEADKKADEAAKKQEQANQKAKAARDKRLAEEAKMIADLQKLEDEFYLRQQSAEDQAVIKRQMQLDQEIAIAQGNAELQKLLVEETEKDIQAIRDKYAMERATKAAEEAAAQAEKDAAEIARQDEQFALLQSIKNTERENEIAALVAEYEAKFLLAVGNADLEKALHEEQQAKIDEIDVKYAEERKKRIAEEKQAKLDSFQSQLDEGSNFVGAMSNLSQVVADAQVAGAEGNEAKQEQIRKKSFERNKALQITMATISGIQGVINALTAQSVIPDPFGAILKGVNAAIVGATAIANIAKIKNTKYQGGGGGGGGAASISGGGGAGGSVPSASLNNSTLFGTGGDPNELISSSSGKSATPVIKAVVVESDVTDAQNNVKSAKETASI